MSSSVDTADLRRELRSKIRKSGISAREGLEAAARDELSRKIAERIMGSAEFGNAKTIMIYKGVRGEVRLESLENAPEAKDKTFVYPLCISKTEMIALRPSGSDSWAKGAFGILEPIRDKSVEVSPDEIDLVICPCTVFDEQCSRMGMGAGYYDRYLELCVNAHVTAAAFEVQKAEAVPTDPWDKPMEKVFTEKAVYEALQS